jgi:hypothetical protein
MRLRLLVRIQADGEAALWQREVERPYPGVPRPEDWVFLGDDGEGHGLSATPVAVVSWENDGTVTLRFDVAAMGPDAERQFETLGFTKL